MTLLAEPLRALILGASGAIGAALVRALGDHPGCAEVIGIHRNSTPAIDYDRPDTIAAAAAALAPRGPFGLIVNAIGVLHCAQWSPEKRLADLDAAQLQQQFAINAIGPALTIKHFAPLAAPAGAVFACLSAKVGSIADNRLGGWYSYRASKAALNMLIKTAAIELRRTRPRLALVAIHPGTVKSPLSRPFRGDQIGREPAAAAADILGVLRGLAADDSGSFRSYAGEVLPW